MEKFHPRGSHSCKPTLSLDEARAGLRRKITSSVAIQSLRDALAPGQLFLVGGTVRDAFFESSRTDLDLATDLSAAEVAKRCVGNGLRVIETGIQHGTVLVVIDDTHIEVTTFRTPADRDTQVNATNIETDLSGRDFTINALAFCIESANLIDPLGGIADLQSMTLRAVGDANQRFLEDPLRILRMIRFGPAEGRSIEKDTLAAAARNISQLGRVSVERIREELTRIIISPCPAAGIITLRDINGLQWTIPELLPAVGFEQNRYHIHDVFDHTMAVLDRAPADPILRWSAIFHDIGKPATLSTDVAGERHFYLHEIESTKLSWARMEQLRFSHDDMKRISSVVRHHMRPMNCGPAGVRRLIRDLGDNLQLWRAFKDADSSPAIAESEAAKTAEYFDTLLSSELRKMATPSYGKLAINGEDLKGMGVKPGPGMGRLLKQLEEIIIDDPSKNVRDTLLELAKSLIKN
jgi:tRNA nucleotidyltransferase (CCA-adding enzyme)